MGRRKQIMRESITPNQRKAMDAIGESCVLTAGAGSGKTRVLVSRYLNLMTAREQTGRMLGPEPIVAITFTEKAASQMRSRLEKEIRERSKAVGEDQPSISKEDASWLLERLPQARIMTIDAFCLSLVKANPLHSGVVADFSLVSPSDSKVIAAECVGKAIEEMLESGQESGREALVAALKALNAGYQDLVGKLAANMITAETRGAFWLADRKRYNCTGSELGLTMLRDNAFDKYKERLRTMRALDFAMIEASAYKLLRSEKGRRIREGIRSVLVDEYQDTNDLQDKIIRLLVTDDENDRKKALDSGKLFIVGDPNQSIYAFRGANPDVFSNWIAEAKLHGTHYHLEKNFRSHPSLVDELNGVFSKLLEGSYEPAQAGRDETASEGRLLVFEEDKASEPDSLARLIKGWVEGGLELTDGRKAAYGDIALLIRKNSSCRRYTAKFEKHGIPYVLNRADNIFASDSCLFLADLIDASLDDMDPQLSYAVLSSPAVRVSQASIARLRIVFGSLEGILSHPLEGDLVSKAITDKAELDRFDSARKLSKVIRDNRRRLPSHSLLQELSEKHGIERLIINGFGRQGVANYRKVSEISRDSSLGLADIGALSEYMRVNSEGRGDISEPDILDSSEDAVKVMTIHAAKGLEFPIVVFADANIITEEDEKDDFITDRSDWSLRCSSLGSDASGSTCKGLDSEESLRIVYVAMTRAEEYLVLSAPIMRNNKYRRLYAKEPIAGLLEKTGVSYVPLAEAPCESASAKGAAPENKMVTDADESATSPMMERASDRQYRFSPSSLMQFELCPKAYLRRYWYRLIELGRPQFNATSGSGTGRYSGAELGTFVHLICSLYEEGDDLQLVIAAAQRRLYGPEPASKELLRAVEKLAGNYVRNLSIGSKPARVLREVPFSMIIGDYTLEGAIDRIEQQEDGKWRVIDIKTNSNAEARAEELAEKYALQMRVYSYVVGRLIGDVSASELHFVNCAGSDGKVLIKRIPVESPDKAEVILLGIMERASRYVNQVHSLELACRECDKRDNCKDAVEGGYGKELQLLDSDEEVELAEESLAYELDEKED